MNIVDIALIAILLIAAIGGFFRGFVHSILAIFAWIAAAFVTMYGFPLAAEVTRGFIGSRFVADIAAGAGLFIATLVVLTLIRHQIASGIRHSALSALDRSLGFVFGLLVGVLLICVIYFGAAWSMGPRSGWPDWAREARTLPVVESTTAALCRLGPASVRELCRQHLGRSEATPAEIERQFQRLTAPPTAPGGTDSRPGYPDRERRSMDRLFEQMK
jgi:membrane protein required for colicin V production